MAILVALAAWVTLTPTAQGAAAGHTPEPAGLWSGPVDSPVPNTLTDGRVVHARATRALSRQSGVVIVDVAKVDAKPDELAPGAPWMPPPHRGLPGARWLPGMGAAMLDPDRERFIRAALMRITDADPHRPLLFYCHESCWLSWNAAKRALGYGYRRVYWFPEGIEGWQRAGFPTQTLEPLQPPAGESPRIPPSRTVAVLDIELSGDLGGPEFVTEHAARLHAQSTHLREALQRSGLFRVVPLDPAADVLERLESQYLYLHDCNACDLEVGHRLQTEFTLVTWVNRVSGLILTLTYELHDVASAQISARRSYDFRGDNDVAWSHAIDYMVRDMKSTVSED